MAKNTRRLIIISIVIVIFAIFFGYSKFTSKNKIVLDEHSELLSIWVEDSSGNYQAANSFPGAGYILDKTRSSCENGGTLSGDGTGVTLTANKTDKCYLYFLQPWLNTNTTRTLTCNNSLKTFDYKINGASFDVSTAADLTCTATKTANSTSQTFAQYLASLNYANNNMTNENGIRYMSKNAYNYIWFNNEMWRIIGVFGSARHGVTNDPRTINSVSDTYLVKIMRNQPIGSYAWNGVANTPNNWPNSTLYRMLNGCYFNALTGSDTTNISGSNVACSNYCIGYFDSASIKPTGNCDFSVIGIQGNGIFNYRDMVETATWYLGGPGKTGYTSYYPDDVYGYETNSNAVYSGRPLSTTGKIGLMYLSDYGYSTISSECPRTTSSIYNDYNKSSCSGNSWIYSVGEEWMITPNSSGSNYVWEIDFIGYGNYSSASNGQSVRPVLYLKSKTYRLSGTGSATDPYVVGLATS